MADYRKYLAVLLDSVSSGVDRTLGSVIDLPTRGIFPAVRFHSSSRCCHTQSTSSVLTAYMKVLSRSLPLSQMLMLLCPNRARLA